MRLDADRRICLTHKALRAAEHFLLSRYFDYQQVAFHKTVAALELVLKDVVGDLLARGMIDCSGSWVDRAIAQGTWPMFDDGHIMDRIAGLADALASDSVMALKARSLLERRPPKLVYEVEYIDDRQTPRQKRRPDRFALARDSLRQKIPSWAGRFGIDPALWYLWAKGNIALTKIEPHVPVSARGGWSDEDEDSLLKAVRVLDATGCASQPIVNLDRSLMSVLSKYAVCTLRLYVALPPGQEYLRGEIEQQVAQELASVF